MLLYFRATEQHLALYILEYAESSIEVDPLILKKILVDIKK